MYLVQGGVALFEVGEVVDEREHLLPHLLLNLWVARL